MEASAAQPRARLAYALFAALVLGGIVVAVAVLGGEDESAAVAAAPSDCVRKWNSDAAATAYGRHNFNFHDYDGALVTFLSPEAQVVESAADGRCAVIFPSRALDPEPFAAGQVLEGENWIPISSLPRVALTDVAELQVDAARAPNTVLDTSGVLTAR